jgi:hypothetical protein
MILAFVVFGCCDFQCVCVSQLSRVCVSAVCVLTDCGLKFDRII